MQNHVKRSSKTKGTHDARRAIRSKARRTTYDAVCKFRQSAACPVLIEYYYTTRLPYIFHAFRAAQSSPEQARAAQSSTEQPRAAQSNPEQPRAAQSRPEQPRAAQSRPEPPRAAQSSPEQPRTAQSSLEQPRAVPLAGLPLALPPVPLHVLTARWAHTHKPNGQAPNRTGRPQTECVFLNKFMIF